MKKALLAIPLALLIVTACDDNDSGYGDAPVNKQYIDDGPAQVINMPDSFANWVMKCDHHGNRLYSNTRDGQGFLQPSKDCPNDWP